MSFLRSALVLVTILFVIGQASCQSGPGSGPSPKAYTQVTGLTTLIYGVMNILYEAKCSSEINSGPAPEAQSGGGPAANPAPVAGALTDFLSGTLSLLMTFLGQAL
ncbi:hypothetical protein J6590_074403 [Homalodisca vitripennis]|nr:hypothetical protein J6590_074403 [Homalodisca vitripennis]